MEYIRQYIQLVTTQDNATEPDLSRLKEYGEAMQELYRTNQSSGSATAKELWKVISQRPEYAALFPPPSRRTFHVDELAKLPPVEFLIEGMIVARGLNELHGASGGGKSLFVLDYIAIPIAQKYKVVYVACEGVSGYADRYSAWEKANGSHERLELYFDPDPVNLIEEIPVWEFIEHHRPLSPCLIIFDTLARCLVGGDENSARDVGLAVHNLGRIQSTLETAVLIVHHTGKTGNFERGSSALRGGCDSMIELTNEDGLITVTSSKLKDGNPFADRYYRFSEFPIGESRSSVVLIPSDKATDIKGQPLTKQQRAILEFLALPNFVDIGAKSTTIQISTAIPHGSLYRVLGKLMHLELVTRGAKGDPYTITEAGKAAIQ